MVREELRMKKLLLILAATPSTPEELAFMKTQLRVWEKMVKDADIKPN
jgi:hypothetical protein